MYKAIGFDYGGVLEVFDTTRPIGEAASLAGVTLEEFRTEYLKRNHLSNVENQDWYEVVQQVFAMLNVPVERQESAIKLLRDHETNAHLNTGLLELMPKLRAQGLKVGLLSNAWAARRKDLEENGVAALFDAVLISGEIGAQKPDVEAFEPFCKALGVEPAELIFVDDSPFSLAKAVEIGYTPLLYKNNEQLFSDLRNLGIST